MAVVRCLEPRESSGGARGSTLKERASRARRRSDALLLGGGTAPVPWECKYQGWTPSDGAVRGGPRLAGPLCSENIRACRILDSAAEGLVVDPASLHDTLFNSVAEAAIVTDAAGRVSAWNARAEFLYGWSPDEALGRPITDLTVPIAGAEDAQQILSALSEGQAWAGEFLVSRRDGSSFWARVRNVPLTSDDGTYQGVLASPKMSPRNGACAKR